MAQVFDRWDPVNEAYSTNASGQSAGGLAGAVAGAGAGMYYGGTAGTAVTPGIGTAIGGAVGGLLGGAAGFFGGNIGGNTRYALHTDENGNTSFKPGEGTFYRYNNDSGNAKDLVNHIYWNSGNGEIYYLDPDSGKYTKLDTSNLDTSGGFFSYASDDQLDAAADRIASTIRNNRNQKKLEAQRANIPTVTDGLSSIAVPTGVSPDSLQMQEYEKRKQEANTLLEKMLMPQTEAGEENSKDSTIYYKYGPDEIDLKYYLHNLGTNLQKYMDSQDWSQAQRNAFMRSYENYKNGLSEQLANNSGRFSTDDGGNIIDQNGLLSPDRDVIVVDENGNVYNSYDEISNKKLRKNAIQFSPNEEVKNYFNTIGQAVVGAGKVRKPSADSEGDFDMNKHGFVRYWANKINPAGGNPDIDPYLALDPVDPSGKRERTNRTKYLAHELNNYLNYINKGSHNFEGTGFKTKEAYAAKIQEAIDNLNNGWDTTDPASLQAIGITPEFYSTLMTDVANPLMSEQELSAEMQKTKDRAASEYIGQLKGVYDNFASKNHTHTEDNAVQFTQDSRFTPGAQGSEQRIATALQNLGFAADPDNIETSVNSLWEMVKNALRSGEDEISTGTGKKSIQEILPIIFPICEPLFEESPDNPGVKYLNDPDRDSQYGAILCYKNGKLFYDFIGNVKKSHAWQKIKSDFEKTYVAPSDQEKPQFSFDKLGGVLKKLAGGGNFDAMGLDEETLAALQQIAEMDSPETPTSTPSTYNPGKALAEALYGERQQAAAAKGMTYDRYNKKQRTPNGAPDFYNKDNGAWKQEDYVRLGAIAADIASIPLPTVAGAAAGFGGTMMNLWADWADDSVTTSELIKNLGMGLGMDALSIIPVLGDAADAGRLTKNLVKMAPKIGYALSAYGILGTLQNAPAIMESLGKVTSDEKLTVGDYQNIAQGIAALAGINGGIKASTAKKLAKKKAFNEDAIGLGLKDKNGNVQDYIFNGERAKELRKLVQDGDIAALNKRLKEFEGFDDFEVNTNLNTIPVGARLPVGRTTGTDGKKSWEVRNPFSVERHIDSFEIFDPKKLRGGYASQNLLNTNRQQAVIDAGRNIGADALKTKAEVDAIVQENLKKVTEKGTALTEKRKAQIADIEKRINGVKDEAGNFTEDGLIETLRKNRDSQTSLEQTLATTKQEFDNLVTKNKDTISTLGITNLSKEVKDLANKRAMPAKLDEKIAKRKVKLDEDIKAINKNKNLTADQKKQARAGIRAKANSDISKLESDKLKIQNDLTTNKAKYDAIDQVEKDLKREHELGLDLNASYQGSHAQQKAALDRAILMYDSELAALRKRLEVLNNRAPNGIGTTSSREKKKLEDLAASGPYMVEYAPGKKRDATEDLKEIISHLFKKGGRLQFLSSGDKFKGRKVGNVTYNRPIDWYDDYITEEGSADWTPEFKQVYGRIQTQADVDEINNFQNKTYRDDFAIGSTNPKSGHEQWLPERDVTHVHQSEYDRLAHEGNQRFTRGTLLGRLPGAMTDDSEQGGWRDGRAGTMTWLRHYGDNIAHVDKINNAGVLGENVEAFWNPQTQMVNFRLKSPENSVNPQNPQNPQTPQVPPTPSGNDPALLGNPGNTNTPAPAGSDPELLPTPQNPGNPTGNPGNKPNNQGAFGNYKPGSLLKGLTDLVDPLDFYRYYRLRQGNIKAANIAINAEKPYLQRPKVDNVYVHGDLESLMAGEKSKADLTNVGYNHPVTSDGAQQMAFIKDLNLKGEEQSALGRLKDTEQWRNSLKEDLAQRFKNHDNEHMVGEQNRLSIHNSNQNIAKIKGALQSQLTNDRDIFLQGLIAKNYAKKEERDALQDQATATNIKLAVKNNPNKYGANLSSQELAAYNKALAGVNPSSMSSQEQNLLASANSKVQLATSSQYYNYKGISPDQWTEDARNLPKSKPSFTPTLTTLAKDGSKLRIARIRNKAKNADRFQKSVQKQLDSLDKKLDRISRSMYGSPKSEIVNRPK